MTHGDRSPFVIKTLEFWENLGLLQIKCKEGNLFSIVIGEKPEQMAIEAPKKKKTVFRYPDEFSSLWDLYEKKGSKKLAYDEYKKLDDDLQKLMEGCIERYVFDTPDIKFRKDMERFFRHAVYERYYEDVTKKPIIADQEVDDDFEWY